MPELSPQMKLIARAVRRRRRQRGLTQEEVAKSAGCGVLFIIHLEAGKQTVRFDKLLPVLTALGFQFALEDGDAGIVLRNVSTGPKSLPSQLEIAFDSPPSSDLSIVNPSEELAFNQESPLN